MSRAREEWLQRVRYTAAEPTPWLQHAHTLRQAAEDLWIAGNEHDRTPGSELGATVLAKMTTPGFERPEMGGSTREVCFMLLGFALENLVKGIIVCRDPSMVQRSALAKWHRKGHDLCALFDLAKIGLSDKDRDTLARASRSTTWKGRYPVPMNFYEVGPQDLVIGHIAISNIWPADEFAALCELYERAKKVLLQTMKDIPPLPVDRKFAGK